MTHGGSGRDGRSPRPAVTTRVRAVRAAGWGLVAGAAGAGAVALAATWLLPGAPLVKTGGVLSLVAVGAGTWWHRRGATLPRDAGPVEPWLLLLAGLVALVAGGGGLVVRAGSAPVNHWVWLAVSTLASYPLLAWGLLRLQSGRLPRRDADTLVEAVLIATASGLVMWAVLVRSAGSPGSLHLASSLTVVVLVALDVGLLAVVARLLLLSGERPATYRYVALAVAYLLGAHLTAALGVVGAWSMPPPAVRVLLVCSFEFWGLAALHPSMKVLFEPLAADPPAFSRGHLAMVAAALLAAPAVIGAQAYRHDEVSSTTAIGAGLLSLAMTAYFVALLRERSSTEHRAQHDHLTDLPNRTLFVDRLSRALAHARRSGQPVAAMLLDLDHFKDINDIHGHAVGDRLLCEAASRLQACVRDEDTVARLAGDEFALLFPHLSGPEGAITVAERLLEAFRAPFAVAGTHAVVTASVGLTVFPDDDADAEGLLAYADAAMYRAKEHGRDTFEVFSPTLQDRARERLTVEAALRDGLENDELVLYYQPIVSLRSGRVVGAEALVRWNHPDRGLLGPAAFVPIAEQSDLVAELGEFVLATACEQSRRWQSEGLPDLVVSVNVSARQFRHRLADVVATVLRETGLDPTLLQLEITEGTAVENMDLVLATLEDLREMGVRCAIDDFGTGYSGLSYLSRLPLDGLKIDRSFVAGNLRADTSIVAAIIAMAHSLGLTATAEGVETTDQLARLRAHGCDHIQGFLFSRPVSAQAFEQLVLDSAVQGPGVLPVVGRPTAGGAPARIFPTA